LWLEPLKHAFESLGKRSFEAGAAEFIHREAATAANQPQTVEILTPKGRSALRA
jgi:hypothetical protein